LDDLFTDTSSEQKPAPTSSSSAATIQRPSRHVVGTTTLGSLLGPLRTEKEPKPSTTSTTATVPAATPPSQSTSSFLEDSLRAKRLENEVERLNREIDELKIRKKEDEQDIERLWKDKLSKKDLDHQQDLNDMRMNHEKHISKLKEEHSEELQRLKTTYERQLDTIQQSVMQWKDVSTVVDKVDMLSSTIHQLTDNVTTVADRSLTEKENTLRIREQQLESREQRLIEEKNQFNEERKKVYELNSKLNELCKGQETAMEQEKYRVREEWNRLNAEKLVFKEDQRFILDNIEKQKMLLEKSKTAFLQEQHDLLVRVCTERQLLEQEKNEFHGKRSADVKRLKEEAGELQRRAQNVLAAERQIDEMKKHYEMKMRQACFTRAGNVVNGGMSGNGKHSKSGFDAKNPDLRQRSEFFVQENEGNYLLLRDFS
uniref:Cilia- and flagella-associated protein 157 n=1 Tax=Angiostrongylus cantonensis TaxID=6313 RepID=A0A0K0DIW7_ANGCA